VRVSKGGPQSCCCPPFETPRRARLLRVRWWGISAMLRIIALVLILVMAPTVAFFLWAWGVKIKEQRKIAGTLPEWQDLPLTWLGIAGLVCTIIGFVVMFFTQNQGYGGLFAP